MTDQPAEQPAVTRDQAIAAAGSWFADLIDNLDAQPARVVAENSNAVTSGEMTVDEVEDLVLIDRGQPPRHGTGRAA